MVAVASGFWGKYEEMSQFASRFLENRMIDHDLQVGLGKITNKIIFSCNSSLIHGNVGRSVGWLVGWSVCSNEFQGAKNALIVYLVTVIRCYEHCSATWCNLVQREITWCNMVQIYVICRNIEQIGVT